MSKQLNEQIVSEIYTTAHQFLKENSNEKGIQTTYGYFVAHPVAPVNKKRLTQILEEVYNFQHEQKKTLKVLDVACGGGIISSSISLLGNTVVGIDINLDEIELAVRFSKYLHVNSRFYGINVFDEGWEEVIEKKIEGKPDVIILAYALHHFSNPEGFIDKLKKWMKPGSIIIVNEENPNSPLFRLKHRIRTIVQKDTEKEYHRTYESWRNLFADGFYVSKSKGIDILPLINRISPLRCWSIIFTIKKL